MFRRGIVGAGGVLYFLVNTEYADFESWQVPYQSLFFVAHLLQFVAQKYIKHSFHHTDPETMKLEPNVSSAWHWLMLMTFVSDVTTLIRQITHYSIDHDTSITSVTRLSLVAVVLFFQFAFICHHRGSTGESIDQLFSRTKHKSKDLENSTSSVSKVGNEMFNKESSVGGRCMKSKKKGPRWHTST